jgi:hypothetical protein
VNKLKKIFFSKTCKIFISILSIFFIFYFFIFLFFWGGLGPAQPMWGLGWTQPARLGKRRRSTREVNSRVHE